jgi:hypothetical protein
MRKLSFEYAFTDSLEIPDGATEHEIDVLISRKIGRMASQIREEVKSKDSYTIHDSENDQKENDKREEKPKTTIGIKNISPVNYDGPRLYEN